MVSGSRVPPHMPCRRSGDPLRLEPASEIVAGSEPPYLHHIFRHAGRRGFGIDIDQHKAAAMMRMMKEITFVRHFMSDFHGISVAGGTVSLRDCSIQDFSHGAALRVLQNATVVGEAGHIFFKT